MVPLIPQGTAAVHRIGREVAVKYWHLRALLSTPDYVDQSTVETNAPVYVRMFVWRYKRFKSSDETLNIAYSEISPLVGHPWLSPNITPFDSFKDDGADTLRGFRPNPTYYKIYKDRVYRVDFRRGKSNADEIIDDPTVAGYFIYNGMSRFVNVRLRFRGRGMLVRWHHVNLAPEPVEADWPIENNIYVTFASTTENQNFRPTYLATSMLKYKDA